MKFKLFLLCVIISCAASAQKGFFGRMGKINQPSAIVSPAFKGAVLGRTTVTLIDSTFGAIRPVIIPMAFSIPDGQIMAGAGFGYQNLTYNFATGKYYCNWSVNIVGFLGGNVAPTVPSMATSYGATVGFLNNSANIGIKFNSRKDPADDKFKLKPNAVLAYYINFNN